MHCAGAAQNKDSAAVCPAQYVAVLSFRNSQDLRIGNSLMFSVSADDLIPLAEPLFDDHLFVVRQTEFHLLIPPFAPRISDHVGLFGNLDNALDRHHQHVGNPLRLDLNLGG